MPALEPIADLVARIKALPAPAQADAIRQSGRTPELRVYLEAEKLAAEIRSGP